MDKKYQISCFRKFPTGLIRTDTYKDPPLEYDEAVNYKSQLELSNPMNIYIIEEINEE